MGEYAEMMLNGACCAQCGELLGGRDNGIPRYCSASCEAGEEPYVPCTRKQKVDRTADRGESVVCEPTDAYQQEHKPFKCSDCGRRFRLESAARDHWRNMHPVTP